MSNGKATILIVDDEVAIRELLRESFFKIDCNVLVAADGRQALKTCRETTVDLVITDLVMPEVEGLEMIQQLHREFPSIPVIAMSGTFGNLLDAATHFGAVAVFEKPIDLEELFKAVRKVLQRKSA